MPRSFFRDSVLVKGPAGTIPLAGAAVSFYLPAAPGSPATPISFPLYRGRDDPDPMVLPYVTGDLGELEVWADAPHRIRIIAAKSGLVSADETIDLEAEPDLGATDEDITDALAAHEADLDPHDQYLTQPEGNLLYLPLAHQPGTDPHPQYLQVSVFTQPDPLGQYQLEAEKAQPSGYAPLDPNGLIPTVHLPPLAITNTFVVASEAEMLALVAQTGDLAIRSDTTKSYILAADPASLLTNWKELSAAAPVLSVDGRVGVVDLSDRYVDVAGDTLTGLLTTTFGPLKTSATAGNRLTWAGDGLFVPPALDQAAADLRYLQLSGGALTGPLSIQSKPVAVSPDAGNILQWLPNGFFAGLSTANVTVLKREEFSPPGSASSVTLAASPNTVLEVSRNGVAQSQALGHYTLLGAVITFADTFAAGEQVLVLYEVGTSQPVDAYTKAQSDARYEPFDSAYTKSEADARYEPFDSAYTKAEGDARYLQQAGADTRYLRLSGGTLTGALNMDAAPINARVPVGMSGFQVFQNAEASARFQARGDGALYFGPGGATSVDTTLSRTGAGQLLLSSPTATAPVLQAYKFGTSTGFARFGQVAADGLWLSLNAAYDGTNWNRDDTTKVAWHESAGATAWSILSAAVGANPIGSWTSRLGISNTGLVTLNADAGAGIGLTIAQGGIMVNAGHAINLANPAQTLSQGWATGADNNLKQIVNGSATGTFLASTGDLYVKGALNIQPGTENLAGEWLYNNGGARSGFVGLEGDYTTWRVYGNMGTPGNRLSINLSSGGVSIPGTLGVSGAMTVTGAITGNGSVLNLASTANIQLSPVGGYIHPPSDNTVNLGHPSINWAAVCAHQLIAPGQLSLNTGAHLVATCGGGGWIYLRSTGHTFFQGSAGAIVAPETDNRLICGGTNNRWQYVAAVQGGINTCFAHEKAIIGTVEPEAGLAAVLATPLVLFHPKDADGNVDESLTFAGPVNTTVDPRLQIGAGALTAPGHQVAYAMAAIKALAAEIADLKARLA